MINFLIATSVIFTLMSAWIGIQHLARIYAQNHPEFGAAKEEGLGCGKSCGCKEGGCQKEK